MCVVSYAIDEEVVIRAPFLVNPPLADEGAGNGPPVACTQENVDLVEANDLLVHQSDSRLPTFDDNGFEAYKMDDRYVSSRDNWIFSLLGKSFHYKKLEFEDDLDFKHITDGVINSLLSPSYVTRECIVKMLDGCLSLKSRSSSNSNFL